MKVLGWAWHERHRTGAREAREFSKLNPKRYRIGWPATKRAGGNLLAVPAGAETRGTL